MITRQQIADFRVYLIGTHFNTEKLDLEYLICNDKSDFIRRLISGGSNGRLVLVLVLFKERGKNLVFCTFTINRTKIDMFRCRLLTTQVI